jgi:hypothetical protein
MLKTRCILLYLIPTIIIHQYQGHYRKYLWDNDNHFRKSIGYACDVSMKDDYNQIIILLIYSSLLPSYHQLHLIETFVKIFLRQNFILLIIIIIFLFYDMKIILT